MEEVEQEEEEKEDGGKRRGTIWMIHCLMHSQIFPSFPHKYI